MALEKLSYRDNLERIKAVYPNKEMLKVLWIKQRNSKKTF